MKSTRSNTIVTDSGETKKSHVMNVQSCRLDIRKNFYSTRVVKEWNNLPEHIKCAKSTNAFKNLYDKNVTEETTPQ